MASYSYSSGPSSMSLKFSHLSNQVDYTKKTKNCTCTLKIKECQVALAEKKKWQGWLIIELFKELSWFMFDIIKKSKDFDFRVSHTYKQENTCADSITNHGIWFQSFFWSASVPPFCLEDFNRNRLGLPSYRFSFLFLFMGLVFFPCLYLFFIC